MLKRTFILCVFALITSLVSAQDKYKSILQLHIFPLTALEIDGGIRAGAEVFLAPRFSIMADYNHLLPALDKDASRINLKGFALRIEPRYFLLPNVSYLGVQLLYKTKTWEYKNDTIAPKMEKYVASFKFGRKGYFNKSFGFDYYAGLGAAMRYNKVAYGEGFTRNPAGNIVRLNLLMGTSLFYRFQ